MIFNDLFKNNVKRPTLYLLFIFVQRFDKIGKYIINGIK